MCLGVAYRGEQDEKDWFKERDEFFESYEDPEDEEHSERDANETESNAAADDAPHATNETEASLDNDGYEPLVYWLGKQLMATKCSNEGAVIEWVLVPFIVEEEDSTDTADVTNALLSAEDDGDEEEL